MDFKKTLKNFSIGLFTFYQLISPCLAEEKKIYNSGKESELEQVLNIDLVGSFNNSHLVAIIGGLSKVQNKLPKILDKSFIIKNKSTKKEKTFGTFNGGGNLTLNLFSLTEGGFDKKIEIKKEPTIILDPNKKYPKNNLKKTYQDIFYHEFGHYLTNGMHKLEMEFYNLNENIKRELGKNYKTIMVENMVELGHPFGFVSVYAMLGYKGYKTHLDFFANEIADMKNKLKNKNSNLNKECIQNNINLCENIYLNLLVTEDIAETFTALIKEIEPTDNYIDEKYYIVKKHLIQRYR